MGPPSICQPPSAASLSLRSRKPRGLPRHQVPLLSPWEQARPPFKNLQLTNVRVFPDLQHNLLSTNAVTADGGTIVMEGDSCKIIKDGMVSFTATKDPAVGGLYTTPICLICTSESENTTDSLTGWHKRLGHLHHEGISTLQREGLVSGIQINDESWVECDSCAIAKGHREAHDTRARRRPEAVGEIVSADLVGPLEIVSKEGCRYVSTIVDHYSGYTDVRTLESKSSIPVLEHVRSFVAEWWDMPAIVESTRCS